MMMFFIINVTSGCLLMHQEVSKRLKQKPDTFEDLKSVLSTISEIRAMTLDVELRVTDLQERYRTLAIYKIEVMSCHLHNVLS